MALGDAEADRHSEGVGEGDALRERRAETQAVAEAETVGGRTEAERAALREAQEVAAALRVREREARVVVEGGALLVLLAVALGGAVAAARVLADLRAEVLGGAVAAAASDTSRAQHSSSRSGAQRRRMAQVAWPPPLGAWRGRAE